MWCQARIPLPSNTLHPPPSSVRRAVGRELGQQDWLAGGSVYSQLSGREDLLYKLQTEKYKINNNMPWTFSTLRKRNSIL